MRITILSGIFAMGIMGGDMCYMKFKDVVTSQ